MTELSEEEREEIVEDSWKKFEDKVEGQVKRGDPVKIVMEDGTQHLSFYGWIPKYGAHPGGMMICSREGDRLIDSRGIRQVRAENVHVILPMKVKDREKDAERPDKE